MSLPHFKPYIGRLFTLKKTKLIPASEDKFARNRKFYNNLETFSKGCLVVDETNTRVNIVTILDGKNLWISKFFLYKELKQPELSNKDYINEIGNKLIKFSKQDDFASIEELQELLLEAGKIIKNLS